MSEVEIFSRDEILHLQLNRVEKKNALNPKMILALTKAFLAAAKNKSNRIILLYGAGDTFCAGADIEMMKASAKQSRVKNIKEAQKIYDLFHAAYRTPLPILARAQGHAFGGALGLLCVADWVGAVEETQFAFSEVKLGIAPAVISPFCTRRIPMTFVQDWMLSGRRFSTDEAYRSGLVQFVGDPTSVDQYVQKMVKEVKLNGPEAMRATKELLRFVVENPSSKWKAKTSQVIAERRASQEGQEGLNGFLSKKPVSWKKES